MCYVGIVITTDTTTGIIKCVVMDNCQVLLYFVTSRLFVTWDMKQNCYYVPVHSYTLLNISLHSL